MTTAQNIRKGFRFADGSVARGDAVTWEGSDSVVIPRSDGHPGRDPFGSGALPELSLSRFDNVEGQDAWEQVATAQDAADELSQEALTYWGRGETARVRAVEAREAGDLGRRDFEVRRAEVYDQRAKALEILADRLRPLAGKDYAETRRERGE